MRVLVAYASKYGATEGIAQRIGETLKARGLDVVVASCKHVHDASGYDAYVVGSATYEFNWRKSARKFVERNAEVLAAKPTWLFASGPLGTRAPASDSAPAATRASRSSTKVASSNASASASIISTGRVRRRASRSLIVTSALIDPTASSVRSWGLD